MSQSLAKLVRGCVDWYGPARAVGWSGRARRAAWARRPTRQQVRPASSPCLPQTGRGERQGTCLLAVERLTVRDLFLRWLSPPPVHLVSPLPCRGAAAATYRLRRRRRRAACRRAGRPWPRRTCRCGTWGRRRSGGSSRTCRSVGGRQAAGGGGEREAEQAEGVMVNEGVGSGERFGSTRFCLSVYWWFRVWVEVPV